jgi:2-dehydropantoate 2-reductase
MRVQGGVHLRTVHGELFGAGAAVERAGGGPPADLVLFTVKSFDTEAAVEGLDGALTADGAVLSLQNGVDNEDVLARTLGAHRILGGVAYVLSTIESPGTIHQTGGPRTLIIGEWGGGTSQRIRRLEQDLRAAGILVTVSEDILREKWIKYVFICAQAGMTALTRLPIGEFRDCPPSWEMYQHILEETVAVGQARRVRIGADVVDAHVALAQRVEPHITSSLHYDLTHGKRLEIEVLHGTVIRYGREAGIPTPACDAVYAALLPHDLRARKGQASGVGSGRGG